MTATILCIKWGTAFGADDVNVLARACRANISAPLRFICLSDDFTGLDAQIECRSIPDIGLSDADIRRPGVWRKLSLYHEDLHDLGQVLFIDLDMAIVGSLDPFFPVERGVAFLDTGPMWRPVPRGTYREAGTGVFTFDPHCNANVLQRFLEDPEAAYSAFANEQDFVAAHIGAHTFWPDRAVLSFKRHLCHRYGVGLVRKPIAPPAGTAIVAFHGTPRPADTRQKLIWGAAPHLHAGRVPWLEAYYKRFASPFRIHAS